MIYKMNYEKIKKALREFNNTIYGKSILVACYTPFLFCFALTFISLILFYKYCYLIYMITLLGLVLLSLIVFCIGTYAFYKELRIFVNSKR